MVQCTQDMRNDLKLLTLCSRRRFLRFICIFKVVNNMYCPNQSKDTLKFRFNVHQRRTCDITFIIKFIGWLNLAGQVLLAKIARAPFSFYVYHKIHIFKNISNILTQLLQDSNKNGYYCLNCPTSSYPLWLN